MSAEDWDEFSKDFTFKFARDSFFSELKELEILSERLNSLNTISPYAGRYYSNEWIRKNVLRQSEDEMEQIDEEIASEVGNPQYADPNAPPPETNPMGGSPDQTGPAMTPSGATMPPPAPTLPAQAQQ
jgi:hypothetical protein